MVNQKTSHLVLDYKIMFNMKEVFVLTSKLIILWDPFGNIVPQLNTK